jgi:antibiotic biosynthesis monooxygenase (ABM) superfamily enzyme
VTAERTHLARAVLNILVYTAARLLLVIVVSVVIYGLGWLLGVREFPVIVAVLLALIIAMPLGMWVFSPLRRRATASLALAGERRRQDREQLRARLRGEVPPE